MPPIYFPGNNNRYGWFCASWGSCGDVGSYCWLYPTVSALYSTFQIPSFQPSLPFSWISDGDSLRKQMLPQKSGKLEGNKRGPAKKVRMRNEELLAWWCWLCSYSDEVMGRGQYVSDTSAFPCVLWGERHFTHMQLVREPRSHAVLEQPV